MSISWQVIFWPKQRNTFCYVSYVVSFCKWRGYFMWPIVLYEATTVGKDFRKPLLLFSSFQVWFSGADFTNNNAFTLCYWDRCTHEEVWYKDLSGDCMICVSKHKRFHTNHLQRIKEHFKYKNIRTRKNSLFFIFLDPYPIFF